MQNQPVEIKNEIGEKKNSPIKYSWLVNQKSKEFLAEHLAMMLSSGMDVVTALSAIEQESRSPQFRKVIQQVRERIEEGGTLWQSFGEAKLLPTNALSLIRVGEESGRLSQNLQIVAEQQRKERGFFAKLRTAMMYPVFVLSVAALIGIGIAWFLLPKLSLVFSSLNLKLPLVTSILISFGNFLQTYGYFAVPSFLVVLLILIYFLFFFSRSKFIGQWLLFHFPGVHGIIQEVQVARLGYVIGTLLNAGLPVLDALESLAQATSLSAYQKIYRLWYKGIEDGHSFQECFRLDKKTNKLLPFVVQQIIVSGEKSGNLANTFLNVGLIFESKADDAAKNLSVILEPALLVIVWLGVMTVALAVILPIYGLIGGMH